MKNKKAVLYIISIVIAILIMAVFAIVLKENIYQLQDAPERLRDFAQNHPVISPFIVISIIILEVIVAPLPGGFIPVITGVLFGTFFGTLYSWIGNVLGAIISFSIARYFGKRVVQKLVEKKKLDFYNTFIEKYQNLIWLMYLVPLFPVDIISFSLGLSHVHFKKFALIITLALLPDMWLLNVLGDGIYNSSISLLLWAAAVLIMFILVFAFIKEKRKTTHTT